MSENPVQMIVNPISGRGVMGRKVEEVAYRLRSAGCVVTVSHTRAAGDATKLARACDDDTRAIVAVGGDGTVREVVEGLLGRTIPIVVMPAGTENLIAGQLAMDADPSTIVSTVLHGRRKKYDVGSANGKHFVIMAGIGFDAEVAARLTRIRTGHITRLSYIRPMWEAFCSYRFPEVCVEVDGTNVFEKRGIVFVGIMPVYGAGLRVTPHALPDDGLFDVCAIECSSRFRLIEIAMDIASGTHTTSDGVIYCRGKRLSISSPESVPIQLDGDPAGTLPTEFTSLPAAVTFLTA